MFSISTLDNKASFISYLFEHGFKDITKKVYKEDGIDITVDYLDTTQKHYFKKGRFWVIFDWGNIRITDRSVYVFTDTKISTDEFMKIITSTIK
jgi:hypothetical protein